MSSPLEKYNATNKDRWEVLTDIPAWERDALLRWVNLFSHKRGTDDWGRTISVFNSARFEAIERNQRIILSEFGLNTDNWNGLKASLNAFLQEDPEKFILVLEIFIKHARDAGTDTFIDFGRTTTTRDEILGHLESILSNGSKWKVVTKKHSEAGLIERVDGNLTESAKDLNNKDMDTAWQLAYGPSPQPSKAIEYAQSAIEHLATSAGLTKVTTKVFGSIIGDIKANPMKYKNAAEAEYALQAKLAGDKADFEPISKSFAQWFSEGMDLVQKSNPSRHKSTVTDGFEISVQAAKQAVIIATVLAVLIKDKHFIRETKK